MGDEVVHQVSGDFAVCRESPSSSPLRRGCVFREFPLALTFHPSGPGSL